MNAGHVVPRLEGDNLSTVRSFLAAQQTQSSL